MLSAPSSFFVWEFKGLVALDSAAHWHGRGQGRASPGEETFSRALPSYVPAVV